MKTNKLYSRKDKNSPHPYPYNLGISTLKFVHGYSTYLTISDFSSKLFFENNPENSYNLLTTEIMNLGLSKESWNTMWECYVNFSKEVQFPSVQSFFISLASSWDWFIDSLGEFIFFCEETKPANLRCKEHGDFQDLHKASIYNQFEILKKVVSIHEISEDDVINIKELFLLRNLGLHKGWKVDKKYLSTTKLKLFLEGEIVQVNFNISAPFYQSWQNLIMKLSQLVADEYALFPNYED